jgi:Flp pilus assembly protein TadD
VKSDDDVRAILPELPPPAPKRREAAIAAALAHFDGMPVSAPSRNPGPMPERWWQRLRGPQAGLTAAAVVVAAISLPLALQTPLPFSPPAGELTPPRTNNTLPSDKQDPYSIPASIPALVLPPHDAKSVARDQPTSQSDKIAQAAVPMGMAQAAPVPPPSPAMRVDESPAIVVQGRAAVQNLQDVPVAVAVVSSQELASDEGAIVVTSSRRSSRKSVGRGDWNACTVNDPSRTLARCRKLADKAPKAVRSQAESYLSDGLTRAWNGQLENSITAFEAAISVAPDLSAAYLNRGLVYDLQGNSEAAIADLNRAVRLSPKSARAYYNRSVLLRKYGDPKRAHADEQKAISLDPRYDAILG